MEITERERELRRREKTEEEIRVSLATVKFLMTERMHI